jgi:hypothetical protein
MRTRNDPAVMLARRARRLAGYRAPDATRISAMDEVIGLFPTPLLRAPGALDRPLVADAQR